MLLLPSSVRELTLQLNNFSGLKMRFKMSHNNIQAGLVGQVLQNIQVLYLFTLGFWTVMFFFFF